jgi:poly(beta-D-mannuronate) lyase
MTRCLAVTLFGLLACGEDVAPSDAAVGRDAGADPHVDASFDADFDAALADAALADAALEDAADGDGGPSRDDGVPPVACDVVTEDAAALASAIDSAAAGDTICLVEGDWVDLELRVHGEGRADAPITVAARTAGATFLTGTSGLRLGGSHLVVQGLVFRDGSTPGGHLIDFRDGDVECTSCRVTNVAVLELVDEGDTKWVSFRGTDNRLDHSAFVGKVNDGALLVVWRPDASPNRHRIDHNYFGERPDLGRNGGETMRIGDSSQHDSESLTVVEDNYFFRSDGEIEVVSNKSSGNVYRRNVFVESTRMLTLRHGRDCVVDANVFLVGGVQGGGVRVVDRGHRVTNNYVEGCRGTSNVRGGIVLMLAEADPAMNGYQQVEDVLVAHNTIVDCEQSLVFGGGRATEAPRRVRLANNLVQTSESFAIVREEEALQASTIEANVIAGGSLGTTSEGFVRADAAMERDEDGLMRPAVAGAVANAGVDLDVETDLHDDPRDATPDVGADELSGASRRRPNRRADVGTTYDFEALRR